MTAAENLQILAATPDELDSLMAAVSQEALRRHPQGDSWHQDGHHVCWSLLQHVCHVRDLEREAYEVRLGLLARASEPYFPDWDGDRFAAERDYDAQDPAAACAGFRAARLRSLQTARTLLAGGRNPAAAMEGVGPVSFERLLEFMTEHDRGHLAMMRRLRAHWDAATRR